MAQDVAPLEVRAVRGFLEHEIFREVRVVVADVQSREEHLRRGHRVAAVGVQPEHAQMTQLVVRQRIGRARIAPPHVPGVLEKEHAHVLFVRLTAEHRLVEFRELSSLLQIDRQIHVRRQLHRAVVRGLHASLARQGIHE